MPPKQDKSSYVEINGFLFPQQFAPLIIRDYHSLTRRSKAEQVAAIFPRFGEMGILTFDKGTREAQALLNWAESQGCATALPYTEGVPRHYVWPATIYVQSEYQEIFMADASHLYARSDRLNEEPGRRNNWAVIPADEQALPDIVNLMENDPKVIRYRIEPLSWDLFEAAGRPYNPLGYDPREEESE